MVLRCLLVRGRPALRASSSAQLLAEPQGHLAQSIDGACPEPGEGRLGIEQQDAQARVVRPPPGQVLL
jgi:hypothetical protein